MQKDWLIWFVLRLVNKTIVSKFWRSRREGRVFDLIPEVTERYFSDRQNCQALEVWKFIRIIIKAKNLK